MAHNLMHFDFTDNLATTLGGYGKKANNFLFGGNTITPAAQNYQNYTQNLQNNLGGDSLAPGSKQLSDFTDTNVKGVGFLDKIGQFKPIFDMLASFMQYGQAKKMGKIAEREYASIQGERNRLAADDARDYADKQKYLAEDKAAAASGNTYKPLVYL